MTWAIAITKALLVLGLGGLACFGWVSLVPRLVPDAPILLTLAGGFFIGVAIALYGKLASLRNVHTNNLIIRGYQDRAVVDQARYVRLRERYEDLLKVYRELGGEEVN